MTAPYTEKHHPDYIGRPARAYPIEGRCACGWRALEWRILDLVGKLRDHARAAG